MSNFEKLNNSELRKECEKLHNGRFLSPWLTRAQMEQYLLEGTPLPPSPMQEVRIHQMCHILERYDKFRLQLQGTKCDANCFGHDDMQVMECQVLNPSFRHPLFPETIE